MNEVRRALTVAVLGVVSACGMPPDSTAWSERSGEPFQIGPYIMLGGPGEAFITVKAEGLSAPPMVEWWVASGEKLAVTDTKPGGSSDGAVVATPPRARVAARKRGDLWVATLRGLPHDAAVAYRVRSSAGDSEPHEFRHSAPYGESFRFAAFGDTRDGHGVHRSIVEAVAREQVDFAIHTGDMVAQGGVRREWDRFFQIERPLLAGTPILPAVGNHDMGNGQYFNHYFLQDQWAGERRYYSMDWGKLRVVAVDSGIECRDGCAQYAFAERALRDGAAKGMLMVMFLHHPPFSSGDHGSDKSVQRPIRDLARRHGVELVITGHDHNYERTRPIDGTTYIVAGSAGAPARAVHPQWFTATARTEPHYVIVDVTGDTLALRAVNLEGMTFDTAVIFPVPPVI
jgi:3',5'-cyclic AMP phosphodiesterase CpdA